MVGEVLASLRPLYHKILAPQNKASYPYVPASTPLCLVDLHSVYYSIIVYPTLVCALEHAFIVDAFGVDSCTPRVDGCTSRYKASSNDLDAGC